MEKIVQQGILYDFYGELLTEHQRSVYESVVYENLSLGEIAGDMGVSRQAVHDMIKRTDKILEGYEAKLGLVKRFNDVRNRIDEMTVILSDVRIDKEDKAKLTGLCEEIKELL